MTCLRRLAKMDFLSQAVMLSISAPASFDLHVREGPCSVDHLEHKQDHINTMIEKQKAAPVSSYLFDTSTVHTDHLTSL